MHAIEPFLGRPEVERLGWVLLHFVWEGTIAAAVLAAALFAMRRASANARYLACCAALAAMAACLPLTWLVVGNRHIPDRVVTKVTAADLEPSRTIAITDAVHSQHGVAMKATLPSREVEPSSIKAAHAAQIAQQVTLPAMTLSDPLARCLPWFAAIWLAGVMILSIRLAMGWSAVRRLRRAASPLADQDRRDALAPLSGRLRIRRAVELLESELVEVPTMIGWLRPAILWPPSLLAGLSIEQFESLLAHELAHIRRHDYLVNLIQTAIETLLFYQPAAWWVSGRIRQERECCCDDLAVATCGNRLSYARALAAVEELRRRPRQFALAADGGRLLTRIRRILGQPSPQATARQWIAGATVLLVIAIALVVSARAALESDDETPRQHRLVAEPIRPTMSNDSAARPLHAEQLRIASANPATLTRILSGHVLDAETGQPVQGFIYEEATFDEQNPARFHWNGEAIGPGSQRDGAFGIVVKNRPGKPVWARIVAPGYVPQPISEKPIVLRDDSVLDKFEVRMRRGKELTGRVIDAAGKPVAASVYLLRNQGRRQVVRDPAITAPNQQFEMLAMTHTTTDADGRFKKTGWDAESGRVAILSGEMNLWVTPIPDDPSDWTIHLLQPAMIECLVDDDSGERQTVYDLDFVSTGRKGWEMLRAYQFNLHSKDSRLVAANHTPSQFELTRRRRVAVGDYEGEFRLADVTLQVPSSATFTIDLRHPEGWPIAGQVVGLKELGLAGAVISVEPPGEVKRGAMTFDAVTCGEDGRFETGRIAPGKYRVHVDAYLPKKQADPRIFRGGLDLPENARPPDYTADAEVVVGDVQPARLKLELTKGGESRAFRELMQYHEQPHPTVIDQFTAPPSAIATADETAAEKPKPAETPKPNDSPMPESKQVEVHGQVIDDETGKPITLFDEQGGHVDPNDPNKIIWGYYLKPNSGGQEGRFDANIDWGGGWRARIIASGYVPQPILTEPPKPGQSKIDGMVLRMKRGRAVSVRVVDHAGKPVKNASLFVVGSRPLDITGDQALMNAPNGVAEDRTAGRHSTDADGRFTLSGIGEDAKNIAVSCPAVDLWIVPAPLTDEAAKDFEIRLPEPGKLIVHYDIPGGPEETTIFLQLHTWDREGWKGVDNRRRPTVKQHGELVLDNMTPGLYEVVRESSGFLDRRQVTIEPGKTVTSDFIRKAGAPITGRVVGLDRDDVQKAKPTRIIVSVHKPGDERNPLAPKFASVGIDPFDKNGKPSDGSFKTEIIPPGEYLVRASVFIEETPEQRNRTGIIPPGFDGEAKVTVPEQGAPTPIEIQLKKWEYKPFEFKKTEPPPKLETPKLETPKLEIPKLETPKLETPKLETPKLETPKLETPKLETPKLETPKLETPKESTKQEAYDAAFKSGLIAPGKSVTTDLIRKAGAPITGHIVGLDREEVQMAKPTHISISVHKPGEERDPAAPKFAAVQISAVDKDGKPSDGSFKTEIIPPGEYLVRARVFIKERPERGYLTAVNPSGFEGEAKVTVPEQGAPPPVEIQLKKRQYKPFAIKKPADAPKVESPKESPKKPAGESPDARGSNRLTEPPADKNVDDVVKQGLQAIGNKQDGDKAAQAAVTKGLLYLAKTEADEATAGERVNEVVTKIDPALAAELLALDRMGAGASTPLDKVDEAGRKLLEKYQKPEEQGLIYFILLQIHGDSGLQMPNRIISYAQQALKYPLGSRHELRVYIYWGDALNVQKTEKPLPEQQRKEAAAVYLKGLKLAWTYPETPPAVPDPPPLYDGPESAEQAARQKAWAHYRDLRNRADFIKEVNSDRAIFIRQIADMYHRLPPGTPLETDVLRKQAAEILQNDAAVARLMAAIDPDPNAVRFGNDPNAVRFGNTAAVSADKSVTTAALEALAIANAQNDPPLNEVKIKVNPALAAELRALDAMRAGTSTPFDKVDEIGRKLLELYQKPEERGQIYYALLQVHGQSGLVTPEHIIEYSKQALKHPLGSRQELMVYIYWGDTLNVRKTEKPWPEQRSEAAAVYLKGLKRVWQYNAPEQPAELPTPPPVYEGPEGSEREAAVAAMQHYIELKNKADFISELIYQRKIFIRQIADMYHRRPATAAEIEALRKQAAEILKNDAAVARLMAAVEGEPKKAGDQTEKPTTKIAIDAIADASGDQPRVLISPADGAVTVTGAGTLETKHLETHLEKPIGKWSKAEDGLEARLAIERVGSNNGTPILATYLELRNVSDSATPIEIALDPSKIEFKVTDAKGKDVPQAGLPYDGIVAQPGPLRLPHDSQLRLGVSGHGAGIPKDEGALLDLASSAVWLFKRRDNADYDLRAKITIAKSGENSWHGTIDVPAVRIPHSK